MAKIKSILICILIVLSSISPAPATISEEIEDFLDEMYASWNEHDVDKLFSYYGSNFQSGDGLDRDQLKELTQTLWESYPDIKVENHKRTIRSQDQYASVALVDFFFGSSDEKHSELKNAGKLSAISQGQMFLRKYGKQWKVESDRSFFELVTVNYGDVKKYLDNNQIYFAVPEQVSHSDQYTGALYFVLPENVIATATINKELIISPPDQIEESFQTVTSHKLERLFTANDSSHNELVSATIIFTKGILEPKLEGLLFISKRVNVIPKRGTPDSELTAKYPYASSETKRLEEEAKAAEEEKNADGNSKEENAS